jgi:hypothetical protein
MSDLITPPAMQKIRIDRISHRVTKQFSGSPLERPLSEAVVFVSLSQDLARPRRKEAHYQSFDIHAKNTGGRWSKSVGRALRKAPPNDVQAKPKKPSSL